MWPNNPTPAPEPVNPNKFFVIVREVPGATTNPEKNVRHKTYESAINAASAIAKTTGTTFIVMQAIATVAVEAPPVIVTAI